MRLRIKQLRLQFRDLPDAFDGLRILQLSDLHLLRWTPLARKLRQHLLALETDLIVLTGDYDYSSLQPKRAAEMTCALLENIHPPLGIYGILGNHDDPKYQQYISGTIKILSNECVMLSRQGQSISIAGIDGRTETSWDVPTALIEGSDRFTILLSHYPNVIFHLPPERVDLVLSGHTHGGQIRLPLLGAVKPLIDGLPHRYSMGLHQHRGTLFYVNSGIGFAKHLPLRVFCPPEIALFTLRAQGVDQTHP